MSEHRTLRKLEVKICKKKKKENISISELFFRRPEGILVCWFLYVHCGSIKTIRAVDVNIFT